MIQGTTWADPQADFALCRACNDRTAEWVSRHPRRFIGSFVLPLQDMTLALTEFTRAVEQLGLRVANVSSNYRGAYLGEAVFDPFWDAVQSRDLVTWIHPEDKIGRAHV